MFISYRIVVITVLPVITRPSDIVNLVGENIKLQRYSFAFFVESVGIEGEGISPVGFCSVSVLDVVPIEDVFITGQTAGS